MSTMSTRRGLERVEGGTPRCIVEPRSGGSHAPSSRRGHTPWFPAHRWCRGRHRRWAPAVLRGRRRSAAGWPSSGPLPREDRFDPPDRAPAAARDAALVLRSRHHAERRVLRPLSRLPDSDERRSRSMAVGGQGARRQASVALDGRPQEVSTGLGDGRGPVLGQQPGPLRAPRARRATGGQGGDGARGNGLWTGARLQDVLKAAGARSGALDVTFDGLDKPAFPTVPDFVKALDLQRIMNDPDVIVAYEMNGQRLPMLNGFPARLVVPGWYATYWVKNLTEITVLTDRFEKFWMKPGYRIPDTPCGCVEPGTAPKNTVPITRMTVRSFIASPASGSRVAVNQPVTLKGIAFDGGYGIREVQVSDNLGITWSRAMLGPDHGRYSFREWAARWTPTGPGTARLMVRAFNTIGESQSYESLWNPAGYLRNVIEQITLVVA